MLDKDEQAEKARRAEERAKRAATKAALHQLMVECGIPIKTPEQKAADILLWQQERDAGIRTICVPVDLTATLATIGQLRSQAGQHGRTAAAFALADRARYWACNGLDRQGHATRNHSDMIHFAMTLHIAQIWRDAGVQNDRLVLDNLSGESLHEVEQVIADTFAEWEAADCPGLDHNALKSALRYLQGHIWMGHLAPYPDCPAPAHPTGVFPEWTHNHEEQN